MSFSVRFRVLDRLCRGGSPARANEDAFGTALRAAFVVDGATSLVDVPLLPGPSDAQWVAIEAAEMLAGLAATTRLNVPALVTATVDGLVARFEARRSRSPAEAFEIPYASLMMICANEPGLEVGWFGDCRLIARGSDGALTNSGPPVVGRDREQERARALAKASGQGAGNKLQAQALPELRAQRNRANAANGFGVLGPDPRCVPLLRCAPLELALPGVVLLMSDGFYALVTDYDRYDDASLLAAAQEKGLEALYRELRTIEENDPQGIQYPRYKTCDDATALLVDISHLNQ